MLRNYERAVETKLVFARSLRRNGAEVAVTFLRYRWLSAANAEDASGCDTDVRIGRTKASARIIVRTRDCDRIGATRCSAERFGADGSELIHGN